MMVVQCLYVYSTVSRMEGEQNRSQERLIAESGSQWSDRHRVSNVAAAASSWHERAHWSRWPGSCQLNALHAPLAAAEPPRGLCPLPVAALSTRDRDSINDSEPSRGTPLHAFYASPLVSARVLPVRARPQRYCSTQQQLSGWPAAPRQLIRGVLQQHSRQHSESSAGRRGCAGGVGYSERSRGRVQRERRAVNEALASRNRSPAAAQQAPDSAEAPIMARPQRGARHLRASCAGAASTREAGVSRSARED